MPAIQTNDFQNAASDIGGAVSSLFGAQGSTASANSYNEAAAIADRNAQITQQETAIKETQQSRQIYKTLGAQTAGVAGAGFSGSGTAGDLMRDSASQGALAKALTADQGAITENSYAEQAGMFRSMASAANSAATGQKVGGIIQAAGGAINLANGVGKIASNLFSTGVDLPAGATELASGAMTGAGALAEFAGGVATEGAVAGTLGAGVVGADLGLGALSLGGGALTTLEGVGAVSSAVEGASLLETVAPLVFGWIVCTELNRQGRLPNRWYATGARRFTKYDEASKRGYYLWAVPAVAHLKAKPSSLISRALEWTFNHRAEYIAAQAGVRGARKTVAGWVTLAGVYGICWALGRTIATEELYATNR